MTAPSPSPFGRSALLFYSCTMFFWAGIYIYMPILSAYAQNVGGSLQAAGLVIGAYGLSQLLLRVPLGLWSDRLRRRKPFLLLGFAFDLVAALGLIFSSTTLTLFLSVFAAGIAASMWVIFTILFSSYFPLALVTRSLSLILFFCRISLMASNYAGGVIAELWGWKGPFYAAAFSAAAGLLLLKWVREKRPEQTLDSSVKKLLSIGRHPQLLRMSFLCVLLQFNVFSTSFGFAPIQAQGLGATKEDLGLLLIAYVLPSTFALILAGSNFSRWMGEKKVIVAGFLLMSAAVLGMAFTGRLGLLYGLQALNGIGSGLASPLLMSLAIQPAPTEQRATAMGFFQSLYAAGMSFGPILSGVAGNIFGLSSVFILSGALCLFASVYSLTRFGPLRPAESGITS